MSLDSLPLDDKGRRMTKWFLACHRARRLWMTKGEKKCGTKWFLACHRARRLWMTKVQNDHNLSVRVNELAYLWVTKGARMTIICLHMSSCPPPLDEKRRRMTIICLCVPSDTTVSEWRKGERNDHNLSPRVIRPVASG